MYKRVQEFQSGVCQHFTLSINKGGGGRFTIAVLGITWPGAKAIAGNKVFAPPMGAPDREVLPC